MWDHLIAPAGLLLTLLVCAFSAWKGSAPERLGGSLIFATCVVGTTTQLVLGAASPVYISLALDGILALGLLALTIRYAALWLGVAMLLQSAAFALHAQALNGEESDVSRYVSFVNLLSLAILAALLFATAASWIKRVRTAEDPRSRPPRIGADPTPA
jgi:hypothetical protein